MPLLESKSNKKLKVLCVYGASQTYTSTVFEHLDAFRKYSQYEWAYLDYSKFDDPSLDFFSFDVVAFHYSVRLPYGQISPKGIEKLSAFDGLKVLFIQDEYDHTNAAKSTIRLAGFNLVFSVVPPQSLPLVYAREEFPGVRFVSNFTGYVPDDLPAQIGAVTPPSQRSLLITYRGRPLPIRYGRLGQEKVDIGRGVKKFCKERKLSFDIAWDEASRIYGLDWYRFVGSGRAMLGSESGSNVFDWDGTLQNQIDEYRRVNPKASEEDVYDHVIAVREVGGLMNQLSPRIFEMAAARTVMVLFEGAYSGILTPHKHYLPLKKDFSNLEDIFNTLRDDAAVDALVEQAFLDLITSKKYSYKKFVDVVDNEITGVLSQLQKINRSNVRQSLVPDPSITRTPYKSSPPLPQSAPGWLRNFLLIVWVKIPINFRPYIKRLLRRV